MSTHESLEKNDDESWISLEQQISTLDYLKRNNVGLGDYLPTLAKICDQTDPAQIEENVLVCESLRDYIEYGWISGVYLQCVGDAEYDSLLEKLANTTSFKVVIQLFENVRSRRDELMSVHHIG